MYARQAFRVPVQVHIVSAALRGCKVHEPLESQPVGEVGTPRIGTSDARAPEVNSHRTTPSYVC